MSFKEIPGKVFEVIKDATGAVVEGGKKLTSMEVERRRRVFESQEFKDSIAATARLLHENLTNVGKDTLWTIFDLTIRTPFLTAAGPLIGLWEAGKHNAATNNPDDKKNYKWAAASTPFKEFYKGIKSGAGHGLGVLTNLGAATGRTLLIGSRYLIGN